MVAFSPSQELAMAIPSVSCSQRGLGAQTLPSSSPRGEPQGWAWAEKELNLIRGTVVWVMCLKFKIERCLRRWAFFLFTFNCQLRRNTSMIHTLILCSPTPKKESSLGDFLFYRKQRAKGLPRWR